MHPVSGRPVSQRGPYFFLSYAHTPRSDAAFADPDFWVERLYRDLCSHVMALDDHRSNTPVGFMDRAIHPGEGWSESLSEALATCRVFVPLYSPRYFRSEQCGREWYAFSQRVLEDRSYAAQPSTGIVPALWVPVEPSQLPGPALRLPFNHQEFGTEYATEGFYGLSKLRFYREQYEQAVYSLARTIVKVAHATPVGTGRPLRYRELPSAFGPPSGPRHVRIVVAAPVRSALPEGRSADCYGESSLDWNPYHPASARPLAQVTAELVTNLDYRTSTVSLSEAADELGGGEEPPDAPTVMLIDRWTLRDRNSLQLLAKLNVAAKPWISVVVPWSRDDPDNTAPGAPEGAELEEVLPGMLQRGRTASRAATGGVPSLEAFFDVLPAVVQWAAAQFARHAVTYPPVGPAAARPRLRGPDVAPGSPFPPGGGAR